MMRPTWPIAFDKIVGFLTKYYFRGEVKGLDNIPDGGALVVGNHSANPVIPDAFMFAHAYLHHRDDGDPVVGLVHSAAFKVPIIGDFIRRLGGVPASHENATLALRNGSKVLVYPGGDWESCRPSSERDRIDFHDRVGFIKLAMRCKVPIVPVVTAGAHDGFHLFTRGDGIARALGLKKFLRIGVFPIGLGFPTGIVLGPAWPFIPLPRKILIECLPAYAPTGDVNSLDDVRTNYLAVTSAMQHALTKLAMELPRSRRRRRGTA